MIDLLLQTAIDVPTQSVSEYAWVSEWDGEAWAFAALGIAKYTGKTVRYVVDKVESERTARVQAQCTNEFRVNE